MKPGVVSKRRFNGKLVLERKMLGMRQVISLNHELCVGCGICAIICPQESPKLSPPAVKDGKLVKKALPDFDSQKCTFCGECVVLCPTNAIEIQVNDKQTVPVVEGNVFPTLTKAIDIDVKKCDTACNLACQNNCPTKTIEVKLRKANDGRKQKIEDITVDRKLCIFCKQCESACPKNAISVTKPVYGVLKLNANFCPEGCQVCLDVCPSKAVLLGEDMKPIVNEEFCIYCGACKEACPKGVISVERTRVLCSEATSGAWIEALEKLTSRSYLVKELTSKSRKRLREAAQAIRSILA